MRTEHGDEMDKRKEITIDQRRAYYWGKVRKYCERYKDFDWPSTELILNFAYTHDVLVSLKAHAEFNLSPSAMNILMILNFGDDRGYMQQELSGLLLVSRANVTKVIDGMEKQKLVFRSSSQDDRRARFVKLTDAGKTLARRVIPIQNKKFVRITAGLSKNEIKTLNQLLTKFSAWIVESRS